MRWIVFRQVAISCLLVALALPAAARTRPHYGGTLKVEIEGDPWTRTGAQPGSIARRLVFDSLTRIDADGVAAPALAIRWASENDDHRWQFWLRLGRSRGVVNRLVWHQLSLDGGACGRFDGGLYWGCSNTQPS